MGAFPPIGRLAKPTGPTGVLTSARSGKKQGGKKTMGSAKGLASVRGQKLTRGAR